MSTSTISAQELAKLSETLSSVVSRMGSFEELVAWFQAQPYVVSLHPSDYLVKTAPPRRELFVQFRMEDGSEVMRAIVIVLYPNGSFGLADVYEP